MRAYVHGGKLGDLVYSIPAFRGCGCELFGVCPRYGPPCWWFDAGVVVPLLESQGIVCRVFSTGGVVVAGRDWVDGNSFRGLRARGWGGAAPGRWERSGMVFPGERACPWGRRRRRNIAEEHLLAAGLPVELADGAWLRVDPRAVAAVVFCRSPRYRPAGRVVDWHSLALRSVGRSVFLGLACEHAEFVREYGVAVPYLPTANYYEAARVMAGAEVVVGNQTGLMAVAAGLGVGRVLERCERIDDGQFDLGWCEGVEKKTPQAP